MEAERQHELAALQLELRALGLELSRKHEEEMEAQRKRHEGELGALRAQLEALRVDLARVKGELRDAQLAQTMLELEVLRSKVSKGDDAAGADEEKAKSQAAALELEQLNAKAQAATLEANAGDEGNAVSAVSDAVAAEAANAAKKQKRTAGKALEMELGEARSQAGVDASSLQGVDDERAVDRWIDPHMCAASKAPLPSAGLDAEKAAVWVWLETYSCAASKALMPPPLHWAAQTGRLDVIKHFVHFGVDLNVADDSGSTPLHLAAENNHLEVVKCLAQSGALLDKCKEGSGKKWNALHVAAAKGYVEIADVLLAAGANVDTTASRDVIKAETALHLAVDNGHTEVVKCLVRWGARLDVCRSMGYQGWAALHIAAAKSLVDIVDTLVTAGADVNAAASNYGIKNETALHVASEEGVVKSLLRAPNVQVDAARCSGQNGSTVETPLLLAVQGKRWGVAALLLEAGASLGAEGSGRPAIEAILEHGELVQLVLEKGVTDLNSLGVCLCAAALKGTMPVLEALLQAAACLPDPLSQRAAYLGAALVSAIRAKSLAMVERLLQAGADPNALPREVAGYDCRELPLHAGVISRSLEIVERLVQAGADPNSVGCCRNLNAVAPILFEAICIGDLEIVKCLVQAGADPNATRVCDRYNQISVILAAVESRNLGVVKYLVGAGADLQSSISDSRRTYQGDNQRRPKIGRIHLPIHYESIFQAASGWNPEMAAYLQTFGYSPLGY
eukprot:jgi/Mesvir1/16472/Mv10031-RA.1